MGVPPPTLGANMAEITLIPAALAGVRHAIDIVRFLRESGTSLENAEQKLKLADLIETLADTRIQLADIQTLLLEKDQKIKELEEAFESKDSLIKHSDAYYETDFPGHAIGEPYCMHCWEVNHKKYHLQHFHKGALNTVCSVCKNLYQVGRTRVQQ